MTQNEQVKIVARQNFLRFNTLFCVYIDDVNYDPENSAYLHVHWKVLCEEEKKISPPQLTRVSAKILRAPQDKTFVGPVLLTAAMKEEGALRFLSAIGVRKEGDTLLIRVSSHALADPLYEQGTVVTWYTATKNFYPEPEQEKVPAAETIAKAA